jgi:hypothetical protein
VLVNENSQPANASRMVSATALCRELGIRTDDKSKSMAKSIGAGAARGM